MSNAEGLNKIAVKQGGWLKRAGWSNEHGSVIIQSSTCIKLSVAEIRLLSGNDEDTGSQTVPQAQASYYSPTFPTPAPDSAPLLLLLLFH